MKPARSRDLKLFEHDNQEKILGEIPRTRVGLIFILANAAFVSILILVLLYMVVRNESNLKQVLNLQASYDLSGLLAGLFMLVIVLVLFGSIIAGYVYMNSYIILTDQKMILINTKGVFARRVSQLSIGDIQDVSIDQNTALSRMFNYGNINIETAGEQANFVFSYAAQPNDNAKFIVDAHEENLKLYGN